MKKVFIAVLMLMLLLSGCKSSVAVVDQDVDEAMGSAETDVAEEVGLDDVLTDELVEESAGITVEKNLLDVELTLPAWFFQDQAPEDVFAANETDGVKSVVANEDGSYTFVISKKLYEDTLTEFKTGIDTTIDEVITDENYVSIEGVQYTDDLSEFNVYVDQAKYEEAMFDSLVSMMLGMSGTMYQLFEGTDYDSIEVIVNVVNQDSMETIETFVYPDVLDELNEALQ